MSDGRNAFLLNAAPAEAKGLCAGGWLTIQRYVSGSGSDVVGVACGGWGWS